MKLGFRFKKKCLLFFKSKISSDFLKDNLCFPDNTFPHKGILVTNLLLFYEFWIFSKEMFDLNIF